MAEPRDLVKEYLLYAPVGLAYFLRDTAPTFVQMFVARGRTVVAPREHALDAELARARSMGQLTVLFGRPELEKRLNELRRVGEKLLAEHLGGVLATRDSEPDADPAPSDTVPTPAPRTTIHDTRAAAALGIDAYDALSASQVIERLDGLSPEERAAVEEYELSHRNRQTILGRLAQLRSTA